MTGDAALPGRIYLPDTNVLINDPDSIRKLGTGNLVVLAYPVLRELDTLKSGLNGVGRAARHVTQWLDEQQEGYDRSTSASGLPMPDGGRLVFDDNVSHREDTWEGFDSSNADDRIILVARKWNRLNPGRRTALVTRDVSMRVRARPLGVLAEDYRDDKRVSSVDDLYSGHATIVLPEESIGLLTDLHRENRLEARRVLDLAPPAELYANQCCTLRTEISAKTVHTIYKGGDAPYFRLVRRAEGHRGIGPMNVEQMFALALLNDPEISVVTLAGQAGSGKTLMALLAGYTQLRETHARLIVYRPNIELGQSLGYLPGTLDEKFAPWTRPVFDNLDLILRAHVRGPIDAENPKPHGKGAKRETTTERDDGDMAALVETGALEVAPISHLRGRSIHDAFIVADEAQNMNHHEVKTLLTRSGQGTKVVLTGDPDQVDLPDSSATTNGLTHVVERFKGQVEFGHLTMTTTVRSRLAALAASLL
jgi:PhoH-like ATPase